VPSWKGWLEAEAAKGNAEAAKALEGRQKKAGQETGPGSGAAPGSHPRAEAEGSRARRWVRTVGTALIW